MQNEILQFNSILISTTTILLHLIYDYNPPTRFAKFKNKFLSGISSNTCEAGLEFMPMLVFEKTKSKFWHPTAPMEPQLTSQHQYHHLPSPLLDKIDQSMPCHDMVMLGSILSSRGGGKWWYWCCEMS
jgi:hypothetical protein